MEAKQSVSLPRIRIKKINGWRRETLRIRKCQSLVCVGLSDKYVLGLVVTRPAARAEQVIDWAKYRLNSGQELLVGGYIPGPQGVDSIIVGFYRGSDLVYVARVRNGFVPATRRHVFVKLQPLVAPNCPFVNLPEAEKGRWGTGLTAEDMKKCVWVLCRVRHNTHHVECRTMPKQCCELGSVLRSALIHSA